LSLLVLLFLARILCSQRTTRTLARARRHAPAATAISLAIHSPMRICDAVRITCPSLSLHTIPVIGAISSYYGQIGFFLVVNYFKLHVSIINMFAELQLNGDFRISQSRIGDRTVVGVERVNGCFRSTGAFPHS
jgi:hypothetical protein